MNLYDALRAGTPAEDLINTFKMELEGAQAKIDAEDELARKEAARLKEIEEQKRLEAERAAVASEERKAAKKDLINALINYLYLYDMLNADEVSGQSGAELRLAIEKALTAIENTAQLATNKKDSLNKTINLADYISLMSGLLGLY
jgi:hypothetical protein